MRQVRDIGAAIALWVCLSPVTTTASSRVEELEDVAAASPIEQRPNNLRRNLQAATRCPLDGTDLLLPLEELELPLAPALFQSIELKLPCFKDLVILIPPEIQDKVALVAPAWAKVFAVPNMLPPSAPTNLRHQMLHLYADKFTTGDKVLIMEPDTVFTDWQDDCFFTPDGKIKSYCFDLGMGNGSMEMWKKGTEHALGKPVVGHCNVNTPLLFPRAVFKGVRERIYEVHKRSIGDFLEDYYEGHSNAFNADSNLFSEYNIMYHYMLHFMPDDVALVKQGEEGFRDTWKCSEHLGAIVTPVEGVGNPQLSGEYFERAYDVIKRPMRHEEMPLDLTGTP